MEPPTTDADLLSGRRVLLHVSGGIAAVKVPELITRLRRAGALVRVTMSPGAQAFLRPVTLQALSGAPVATRLLDPGGEPPELAAHGMSHLTLGAWAEVQAVVPATASILARLATGLADEIVSGTALACPAPLIVAPAMEGAMWRHPATVDNVAALRARGAQVVGPVTGRLASGREDAGRLAPLEEIVAAIRRALGAGEAAAAGELAGWVVVVTAGGTREPIDPVRYLGNRSSGKMGWALAAECLRRGARVVLVTAAPPPPPQERLEVREVETAAEMLAAVRGALGGARCVLMAAAVADYRVPDPSVHKRKREADPAPVLTLVPTVDVLAAVLAERPPGCLVVGFAAETEAVLEHARRKLARKGVDLLVANQVSGPASAMGGDEAAVTVLRPDGTERSLSRRPKAAIARAILDEVVAGGPVGSP
ncbi:MAG TPA: bifunctional phosphopantothenoylcysteine decarboxylase/phosphopantothenate--cysteine ligase CoaBC, partial [Candidatus Dormibacteraeota bacterium]|nr:bifunctional phosphopantothenoylcysteine decarboxylase/phosphopantothenate--cysteine ligase CoaBC [Candidatus Dormibacteraeota bacterium]